MRYDLAGDRSMPASAVPCPGCMLTPSLHTLPLTQKIRACANRNTVWSSAHLPVVSDKAVSHVAPVVNDTAVSHFTCCHSSQTHIAPSLTIAQAVLLVM